MRIPAECFVRSWLLLAIVLLGTLIASDAFAQLPTGTILGTVRDTSGAAVPGASVTVRNVGTGLARDVVGGDNGAYRVPALPVGQYEVRAELQGFRTQVQTGLTLTVGQELVVNLELAVGAVEETVSVVATAPLVNTTTGSLGGLVDEERIADLPLNGRNYADLTLLQTGVQLHRAQALTGGRSGVWYSSNGAPTRSNNLMIDGTPMTNLFGASSASVSGSTLGVEGIQEFRIVTNSFSAEYGMTMGSQMTIVTKSGTNTFSGSLFEYHRNSKMDARNFFDRSKPPFTRNNFGGSFGGPVRRNRTFFHVTYEGVREELGNTLIRTTIPASARVDGGLVPRVSPLIRPVLDLFPLPNAPDNQYVFTYTQPTVENYVQGRVDQNFSQNDTFFARYTLHRAEVLPVLTYPQFWTINASDSHFLTLSENHTFTSALLNSIRASFSRTTNGTDNSPAPSGPGYSLVPGWDLGSFNIGGVSSPGPASMSPTQFDQDVVTIGDDLFYTRGSHSFKFGALVNFYKQFMLNSGNIRGQVSFPNLAAFLTAMPSSYSANLPTHPPRRTYTYTTVGAYVQDDWRPAANLTVNLGLRYEIMTEPGEVDGLEAGLRDIRNDAQTTLGRQFENPSLKNWGPRLGLAWDIRGNGKTALRAGFARLYDIGNIGSALFIAASGTPPYARQGQVSGPLAAQLFSIPLQFPSAAGAAGARMIDYHLGQPHMHHYNVTLERELPWQMGVMVAYAGSRGWELHQSIEGNPTIPQMLPDGQPFWTGTERRVNPNFGSIDFRSTTGQSWYDSLQLSLTKRLTGGLQFQSSYTYGKARDVGQGMLGGDDGAGTYGLWPGNPLYDKGPSGFDLTHNWRFNTIYRLPTTDRSGAVAALLNGWWVSTIVAVNSGYPFTPTLSSNRSRSGVSGGGASDLPNLAPGVDPGDITKGVSRGCLGVPAGTPVGTVNMWFDPCAFTIPPAGTLGNAGRNSLRGPGYANVDLSLAKDTRMQFWGDAKELQLRVEIFNLLNRVNLSLPSRAVFAGRADVEAPLPTAGRITSTASTARQVQLAVKLLF